MRSSMQFGLLAKHHAIFRVRFLERSPVFRDLVRASPSRVRTAMVLQGLNAPRNFLMSEPPIS